MLGRGFVNGFVNGFVGFVGFVDGRARGRGRGREGGRGGGAAQREGATLVAAIVKVEQSRESPVLIDMLPTPRAEQFARLLGGW